jgi:hypothetical protein
MQMPLVMSVVVKMRTVADGDDLQRDHFSL